MKLAVVIGTYNRLGQLKNCLNSVIGKIKIPHEIIVVDAGSDDGTCEYVRELESESSNHIKFIEDGKKIGQARSLNRVFKKIDCQYTCWISDDNVCLEGTLEKAVKVLEDNCDIGMVALKVKDLMGPLTDLEYIGSVWPSGVLNVNQGMLRTNLLNDIGGFDIQYRDYGIDADLTTEVLVRGYKVVYTKDVVIHHYRDHDNSPGAFSEAQRKFNGRNAKRIYRKKFFHLYEIPYSELKQKFRKLYKSPNDESVTKKELIYNTIHSALKLGKMCSPAQLKKYCMRDFDHIARSKFISANDMWENRDNDYYLVQKLPEEVVEQFKNRDGKYSSIEHKEIRSADVLWLLDDYTAEFDAAVIMKNFMNSFYDMSVEIRQINFHMKEYFEYIRPRIVVIPELAGREEVIKDLVDLYRNVEVINLGQYSNNYSVYDSGEYHEIYRNSSVRHCCYNSKYRESLLTAGIPENNITELFNPSWTLWQKPYVKYFATKKNIGGKFGLDISKPWTFVDGRAITSTVSENMDEDIAGLLTYCSNSSSESDDIVIFRPPSELTLVEIYEIYSKYCDNTKKIDFHILTDRSYRDWLAASDKVVSPEGYENYDAILSGKEHKFIKVSGKGNHRYRQITETEQKIVIRRAGLEDSFIHLTGILKNAHKNIELESEVNNTVLKLYRSRSYYQERVVENNIFLEDDLKIKIKGWIGRVEKSIDAIILVEHIARELDTACAVKAVIQEKFNHDVRIFNVYQHTKEILKQFNPKVVVHPFFYFKKGAMATEEYVDVWPDAIHFCMSWEELFYKAHQKIKAPSDEFAKKKVLHHAWGDFYRKYLKNHGVPKDNVFVNGQPVYQLYKEPYSSYFKTREELAEKYSLDINKRWIFIPENFRWAFLGKKIKLFKSLGGNEEEMKEMQEFSINSLNILLEWCTNAVEKGGEFEIIFRPRPATETSMILEFYKDKIGEIPDKLRIIKEESVREWVLASDTVISSYSTTLIEAAIAGKQTFIAEPIKIPKSLYYDWNKYVKRIENEEDFIRICLGKIRKIDGRLRKWAEKEMLAYGDPIERLAEHIKKLINRTSEVNINEAARKRVLKEDKNYFNPATHEKDVFTLSEVENRVLKWRNIIYPQKETGIVINKTMDIRDFDDEEVKVTVNNLNGVIEKLYKKNLYMSSWLGTVPVNNYYNSGQFTIDEKSLEGRALKGGVEQRHNYKPLINAFDDYRIPWFLYWEISWVLKYMNRKLTPGMRILDAGGSSSLFTCYMADRGFEMCSVDLNEELRKNGEILSQEMGWNMRSYSMDLQNMDFPDEYFDHAFSICVFEHMDYDVKQKALAEIARCLKPGGIFSMTFDYKNPAPGIFGYGKDTRPRNQLNNFNDIVRSFLSTGHFELLGNREFHDNNELYLHHPKFDRQYTFGSIFMRKRG